MNLEDKCSQIMERLMPALETATIKLEPGTHTGDPLIITGPETVTIATQLEALRKVWLALKALAEAT